MIETESNGYEVKSEKGNRSLGKFTVKKSGDRYQVKNSEGKEYKSFDSHKKAINYAYYLAHKQLATVEYFKHHVRANTLPALLQDHDEYDVDIKKWGKLNEIDSVYKSPANRFREVLVGNTSEIIAQNLRLLFIGNEDNMLSAFTDFIQTDYRVFVNKGNDSKLIEPEENVKGWWF